MLCFGVGIEFAFLAEVGSFDYYWIAFPDDATVFHAWNVKQLLWYFLGR